MALETVASKFLQRWTNLLPPNTCYPPPTPLPSGSRSGGGYQHFGLDPHTDPLQWTQGAASSSPPARCVPPATSGAVCAYRGDPGRSLPSGQRPGPSLTTAVAAPCPTPPHFVHRA